MVRVAIDISQPLSYRRKLSFDDDSVEWISF